MEDHYFNKETVMEMFKRVEDKLNLHTDQNDSIITQVKKTNGRVTALERYLLIVAVVVATLLFTSGSEVVDFVMKLL